MEKAIEDEASTKVTSNSQHVETPQTTDAPDSPGKEVDKEQHSQAKLSQATNGHNGAGEVMEVEATMETTHKDSETSTEAASAVEEGTTVGEGSSVQPMNRMIAYYEWQMKHHQWLNAMMRQALGDKEAPEPPHILHLRYPVRPELEHNANLEPRQKYTVRYDLQLVVEEATNLVEAYQQAVLEWFNKILEIDLEAVIYPWGVADRQASTSVIEDPDELPMTFSSIKKYTPKAWI